jgi:hypothetical protein
MAGVTIVAATAAGPSEAKLPEDLPPSYEAIFPGPVPEKR